MLQFKTFLNKNTAFVIFISFVFLYFFLGLCMVYSSEDLYNQQYNLVYNTDTKFVYDIFNELKTLRFQHPFEIILISPLISLIKAFITSPRVAFNFLIAICSSLSTTLIYLGMYKLSQDKKYSVILSLIYGFSYSALVFSTIPEIYVFSGLFNTLFLYYVIILYVDNNLIFNKRLVTLALLLLCAFGINPINIFSDIAIAILIICAKTGNSYIEKIKNILKFILIFCLIWIFFILIKKIACPFNYSAFSGHFCYPNFDFNWLIRDMFIVPLYSLKSYIHLNFEEGTMRHVPKALMFEVQQCFLLFIPAVIFYSSVIVNYLTKIKANKYNDLICILLFPLTICFIANMCSETPLKISLLYSQNFLSYLIFLIGLLIITNKNRFIKYICIFFIVWQIMINLPAIVYIIQFVNETALEHYPAIVWLLYSVITVIILILIRQVLAKIINNHLFDLSEENKFNIFIYTYISYAVIWSVFFAMFHFRS